MNKLIITCIIALFLVSISCKPTSDKAALDINELACNSPIEATLAAGTTQKYKLVMAANEYRSFNIDQKTIDIMAKISDAKGELLKIDRVRGTGEAEKLVFFSELPQTYTLEISSPTQITGKYTISNDICKVAETKELDVFKAQKKFLEAENGRIAQAENGRNDAIKLYTESAEIYKRYGYSLEAGCALNGIGLIYTDLDHFKAIEYAKQALVIWKSNGSAFGTATALNIIGSNYYYIGDFQMASPAFEEALPLANQANDIRGKIETLTNIGSLHWALYELQQTVDYYNKVQPLLEQLGNDQAIIAQRAIFNHDFGSVYVDFGQYEKALEYFNVALEFDRQSKDIDGEAQTLLMLGRTYSLQHETNKAINNYNQSLLLVNNTGNIFIKAIILQRLANEQRLLHHYDDSIKNYELSLQLYAQVKDKKWNRSALSGIANTYLDMENYSQAAKYYQAGLKLGPDVADDMTTDLLFGLAQTKAKQHDLMAAKMYFEKLITLINSQRLQIDNNINRITFFGTVQKYYGSYIDVLMKLAEKDSKYALLALSASEQIHARGLIDKLAEANININAGVPQSLLDQEKILRENINKKIQSHQKAQLSGSAEQSVINKMQKEIENLLQQLDQLKVQIREANPQYITLRYPTPLTSQEIQSKLLDDNTAILEYSLGETNSYVWVLDKNTIKWAKLSNRKTIEELAQRFYDAITARSKGELFQTSTERDEQLKTVDKESVQFSEGLSKLILEAVYPSLTNKRVVIIPDGSLHYIPFAALRIENHLLITSNELINIPSASVLSILRQERIVTTPTKTALIFADPVFDKQDSRVANKLPQQIIASNDETKEAATRSATDLGRLTRDGRLPRLVSTGDEATTIQALNKSIDVVSDFNASVQTLKGTDLSKYKILHFATHGFLNNLHPELSGIVLSLVNENGEDKIGFLPASEIFNLKVGAGLVVLSACSTGLGKEVAGEGVIGLTQGFFYAGAKKTMVSLWNVNDKATSELMKNFYTKMLNENKPPSQALREAQIEMSKSDSYSSPYYWAAFVVQGDFK